MKFIMFSLLLSSQIWANPIITLDEGPADIGTAGGQLYVREGTKIYKYDGLGIQEIGKVAGNPFSFIPFRNALITREGSELHRYANGEWEKIGAVGGTPFHWLNTPEGLFTREGSEIHLYNGTDWEKIGSASTPFSWQYRSGRLYTREAKGIHLFKNGEWDKVGVVGAEPFSMAITNEGLLTIEGRELHTYTEQTEEWSLRSRVNEGNTLFTSGRDTFFRRGTEVLRHEGGSWQFFASLNDEGPAEFFSTRRATFVLQGSTLSRLDYNGDLEYITEVPEDGKVVGCRNVVYVLKGRKIYSYR